MLRQSSIRRSDTISYDFFSPGYSVINAPRSDDRRGGSLAIFYRVHLNAARGSLKIAPSAFEVLVLRVDIEAERFFLAKMY